MPALPSDAEVAAKAAELGVDLSARGARARVMRAILAAREEAQREADAPPAPAEPQPILLSRSVTMTAIGQLVLDLHLIPNDPNAHEENRDDRAAAAQRPDGDASDAGRSVPDDVDDDPDAG